jgi:hypothetical protein
MSVRPIPDAVWNWLAEVHDDLHAAQAPTGPPPKEGWQQLTDGTPVYAESYRRGVGDERASWTLDTKWQQLTDGTRVHVGSYDLGVRAEQAKSEKFHKAAADWFKVVGL